MIVLELVNCRDKDVRRVIALGPAERERIIKEDSLTDVMTNSGQFGESLSNLNTDVTGA